MSNLKNLRETVKANFRETVLANPVGPITALLSILITGVILMFSSNAVVSTVGAIALVIIGVAVLYVKVTKRRSHSTSTSPVFDWTKIPGLNRLK